MNKQLQALIKQELKMALRSRYVKFAFILIPLIMWVFMGLEFYAIDRLVNSEGPRYEGRTLYIADLDNNNLSEDIIDTLRSYTLNSSKRTGGINLNVSSYENRGNASMDDLVRQYDISPLIIIPQNFTIDYYNFNQSDPETIVPIIQMITLPADRSMGYAALSDLVEIVDAEYRVFEIQKTGTTVSTFLTAEGEEGASNVIFNLLMMFFSVVLSVVAPAAYISSAVSKEREQKTLEGLLVLPMSSEKILAGKILAGVILLLLFSLVNIIGMSIFRFLVLETEEEFVRALGKDMSNTIILLTTLSIFISSCLAMSLGIGIVSLVNNVRSAENAYMATMMIPAITVVTYITSNNLPDNVLFYLIPWGNTIAIMLKMLYPKTYDYAVFTTSAQLDILFHFMYLVFFTAVSLFISARLFKREKMIL